MGILNRAASSVVQGKLLYLVNDSLLFKAKIAEKKNLLLLFKFEDQLLIYDGKVNILSFVWINK